MADRRKRTLLGSDEGIAAAMRALSGDPDRMLAMAAHVDSSSRGRARERVRHKGGPVNRDRKEDKLR